MSQTSSLNDINNLPTVPTQFTTDSGIAIPALNNLNIFGSTYIDTSGSGDTVTISATGLLPLSGGTMTGDLFLNADPTSPTQAATKNYVDSVASGIAPLNAVYAASTGNLNATYNNGISGVGATLTNLGTLAAFTLDGTSPPLNSTVLIKDQSTTSQNGIYTVTTVGSGAIAWVLTRATFYDQPSEITPGDLVPVNNGTVNANTSWLETATVTTIGTDPILFTQFTFNPATFLKVANNLSDVASVSTSRTNLGLGTGDSPTFVDVTLSGLSASRLVSTDGSKALASVSDLTTWVLGTSNRITSTSNGSGGTTIDIAGTYVGQTSITTLGTIATGTWQGSVIAGQYGGTGVANTGLTINLSSGAVGKYLASDVSGNATWATLSSAAVTSISATSPLTANGLSGSAQTGAVTVAVTASALTSANDTNVTLTLGGTPTTALLQAASITAGWTGTLSGARGGTGVANTGLTINLSSGGVGKYLASDISGNATWAALSTGAVTSLTGTANQVLVNGTTGSATTGAITLTTPQDIGTSSTVQFGKLSIGGAIVNTVDLFASFVSASFPSPTIGSGWELTYSKTGDCGISMLNTSAAGRSYVVSSYATISLGKFRIYDVTAGSEVWAIDSGGATIQAGKMGVGVTAVGSGNYLEFGGTWSRNANSQFFLIDPNIQLTSSSSAVSIIYSNPTFTISASQTLTAAANLNLGSGTASLGSGAAITNGYNLYCPQPSFGTNAYSAYFGQRVGFNDVAPTATVTINGAATSAQGSGTARATYIYSVDGLTASANSAVLTGLGIGSLKFLTGSATGLAAIGLNLKVSDATKTGTGTIDNAYALRIEDSWASVATTKYSLYNASSDLSYFAGNVSIGTTSGGTPLQIALNSTGTLFYIGATASTTSNAVNNVGIYNNTTLSTTAASTTSYGLLNAITFSGSGSGSYTNAFGANLSCTISGGITATNAYTLYVSQSSGGTGERFTAYFDKFVGIGVTPASDRMFYIGGTFLATNDIYGQAISARLGASSGTISNAHQFYLYPNYGSNAGTISSAAAIYVDAGATAGTITTGYGVLIQGIGYGTTRYGLYVGRPSSGTNRYTAYFDPIVGIGVTPLADRALRIGGSVAQAANNYGTVFNTAMGSTSGTIAQAFETYIAADLSGNSATVTDAMGLYINAGTAGGTVTTGWGMYVELPAFGTTKHCAYFDGNSGFFVTPSYGSGTKVLFIGNRSVAPSTNPTGGGILYAESGALKWRGSSGNVTTIAIA